MLTYLSLHLNKWRKRPFVILLLAFPLLCTFLLYPFFENTAGETAVPIAVVDEDQSDDSRTVTDRVEDSGRVRLVSQATRAEAETDVQKGAVEAAFIIEKGFQASIRQGEVNEVITWIRNENSALDVFAKEAFGAELMRLALNAKAAVIVEQETETSFEEVFQYSDQFWEPEPLFQVSVTERSPQQPEREEPQLQSWQVTVLQLFFLYAWLLAIFFLYEVTKDENSGRLARIKLIQKTTASYFFAHFVIFAFIGLISYILPLNGLFFLSETPQDLMAAWNIHGIIVAALTFIVTWCLFMAFGKKRWAVYILMLIAVSSFIFTITQTGFTDLWPHQWLLINQ
ncbi:ABC transporter permease [Halobacillus litoralis]|uniref:ABC transporter permease n=1 Tax=Halobacillus litoralis TaxID=45668 RepID=UPI001CFE1231|nr:ABC transporter permease [Halobacillus litoralis]